MLCVVAYAAIVELWATQNSVVDGGEGSRIFRAQRSLFGANKIDVILIHSDTVYWNLKLLRAIERT